MYVGKSRGQGVPCVFDAALHRETLDRHQLERDLRDAVRRGELRVMYQPLVRLLGRDIVGVEALLRWDHPTRGTVRPVDFIPLAETTGAILEMGDWVLRESLSQLRAWDAAVPQHRLSMSVNVSPRQLADPEFVTRAADALSASGLDPSRVTLEITEASFGEDAETMIARLHELKALGVMLAIDDFGTEYSSLSKLRQIPVDTLKIDKSFVDGIADDQAERALTAAIVSLASSLDKSAVAEGIETEGQRSQLLLLGVELGQGYLFSRPVPPEEISDRVQALVDRLAAVGRA
jgi:EAL domain-containing protein (putative c-di-GMP-specific phosphodiesterase class I)